MKEINVTIIINGDDLREVARAVTALSEAAGKLNAAILINRVNTTEVKWTDVLDVADTDRALSVQNAEDEEDVCTFWPNQPG